MIGPPLVAVAHGSRDPRSAATVASLADEVRRQRGSRPAGSGPDVRVSFLDLSAPRLSDVLDGVAADGHRHAVVVPLLLGDAFHARSDIPGAVTAAMTRNPLLRIDIADVLGPDPGTDGAALSRLCAALTGDHGLDVTDRPGIAPGPCRHGGPCDDDLSLDDDHPRSHRCRPGSPCEDVLHDPELGVVLASVGSGRADANRAVADRVARWRERFGWAAASAAHVTAAEPTPTQAIDAVRAAGARRVAVVPWVLAPGRLPDRIDAAAAERGAVVAHPIGAHPDLAAAVLRRWSAAASGADVRQVG